MADPIKMMASHQQANEEGSLGPEDYQQILDLIKAKDPRGMKLAQTLNPDEAQAFFDFQKQANKGIDPNKSPDRSVLTSPMGNVEPETLAVGAMSLLRGLGTQAATTKSSGPGAGRPGQGLSTGEEAGIKDLEGILDRTGSARPNPMGHGTFKESLGGPDTAGLRSQKNVSLRRSVGDVREQVGRGVGENMGKSPMGDPRFEASERMTEDLMDPMSPGSFLRQLEESIANAPKKVSRRKPGRK